MILADPNALSRAEIKQAFKRHRSEKAKLARELGLHRSSISLWFANKGNSRRVDDAVRQRAAELINAERAAAENK